MFSIKSMLKKLSLLMVLTALSLLCSIQILSHLIYLKFKFFCNSDTFVISISFYRVTFSLVLDIFYNLSSFIFRICCHIWISRKFNLFNVDIFETFLICFIFLQRKNITMYNLILIYTENQNKITSIKKAYYIYQNLTI